jgi:hypothetical protein
MILPLAYPAAPQSTFGQLNSTLVYIDTRDQHRLGLRSNKGQRPAECAVKYAASRNDDNARTVNTSDMVQE